MSGSLRDDSIGRLYHLIQEQVGVALVREVRVEGWSHYGCEANFTLAEAQRWGLCLLLLGGGQSREKRNAKTAGS